MVRARLWGDIFGYVIFKRRLFDISGAECNFPVGYNSLLLSLLIPCSRTNLLIKFKFIQI